MSLLVAASSSLWVAVAICRWLVLRCVLDLAGTAEYAEAVGDAMRAPRLVSCLNSCASTRLLEASGRAEAREVRS